ncbi:Glutamate--tRNA ligase [Purpureocillium takamizusanense]|uniref:Glutamate--tRNA ligase, mitochondrial n=1 Tax=Purpureocillium takamizusanense TaxID=2060973 RepID=A0A9Q8QAX8_9HYPO|nr:Glutamate--tRNA ligase [Purpureocillium takamizusanense]UNI17259.1 Glutamate--tRNA ligase [Purpureocillium takamizusanense]
MFITRGAYRLVKPYICPRCSTKPPTFARLNLEPPRAAYPGLRAHSTGLTGVDGEAKTQEGASVTTNEFSSGLKGLRNKNKALKKKSRASSHDSSTRTILGQSSELPIRARFAPSPTGYLHLGSLRTALFNKLASTASTGGAFILRIEDTDQGRLVPDAEERLIKDLEWAGLSWDEGPDRGGPYGPYRQSERLEIYKDHVQQLIDRGHAYRCFCSPEQLEAQKRKLHDQGKPTVYPGTCRSVDASESNRRAAEGESHVVRLKSGTFGRPKFRDAIYGSFQKKDPEEDFILLKTDGFPTYHLANVVDDHLMKITHVIRGEEWLISTPKHLALYEAFGWQPPTFAHLALLVNSDGSKLSKRNDSVNISQYQNGDVFPMALLAWLANLGSSFKPSAKTPRTVNDIANALTFKFTRGGIELNLEKLEHFHKWYRDALLADPIPELSDKETKLIDQYLVQPMLRYLEAVTNGADRNPNDLPQDWEVPLLLIPALTSDAPTKASHLRLVLASRQGGYQSPRTLIQQHPYIFWRVPVQRYETSLSAASSPPDQRILNALDRAIEEESLWRGDGTPVVMAILDTLQGEGIDQVITHNTLRLVGAGGQDVVSQSSASMFMLLGRDEWRHRLDVVRSLITARQ